MPNYSAALLGSPMLDGALGQVDSMISVQRLLIGEGVGADGSGANERDEDSMQFDAILPPEQPTEWVQCDSCHKWRRVAWSVDPETLPEQWVCSMNTWDKDRACCDYPQDDYDPEQESTLTGEPESSSTNPSDYPIGSWWDVFCIKNRLYYEAQVRAIKLKHGQKPTQVKFHFKGWGNNMDEWIELGSSRIQKHNLFTNPCAGKGFRSQERWQGAKVITPEVGKKNMITGNKRSYSASGPSNAKAKGGRGKKKRKADS